MRSLVTAGNTRVPIDQVRAITNIFSGRTGSAIAEYLAEQGDEVILLTSNPKIAPQHPRVEVVEYQSFDQLQEQMESYIHNLKGGPLDAIIHSAAVSDYRADGLFRQQNGRLEPVDQSGKVSSDHQELFLRMVPTPKLIDLIRAPWGFQGTLVKFKLQVGLSDQQLLEIAWPSLYHSGADFLVANCLEWSRERAYLLDARTNQKARLVDRAQLPSALYQALHGG